MVKEYNQNFRVGQGGIRVVTADETIPSDDQPNLILVDASAGPVTITLFPIVGLGGKRVCVKKIDSSANAVTIDPAAGETIDGAASDSLANENDSIELVSDNENWVKPVAGVGAGGGTQIGTGFPDSVPFKQDASLEEAIDYEEFNYAETALATLAEQMRIRGWEIDNLGGISLNASGFFHGDVGIETSGVSGQGEQLIRESHFISKDRDLIFKARVHLGSPLTDNLCMIGFTDTGFTFNAAVATAEAGINDGLWFRFSQSNSANWQVRMKRTGQDLTVDSGVAVTAGVNNAFDLEIHYAPSGAVEFFINGTSVHSTTLAGALGSPMNSIFTIIAEAAANPTMVCEALYTIQKRI